MLNYFRQLISAYKMAAHNYFLVCVYPGVCSCVCVCACLLVVLIYSCTFLKRPSQSVDLLDCGGRKAIRFPYAFCSS